MTSRGDTTSGRPGVLGQGWHLGITPLVTAALLWWTGHPLAAWIIGALAVLGPAVLAVLAIGDRSDDGSLSAAGPHLVLEGALVTVTVGAAAGAASLLLPDRLLLVWLLALPSTAGAAVAGVRRLVADPASPVTSSVVEFCVSGLLAAGVGVLVLVVASTTGSDVAALDELTVLTVDGWTTSPELLRGLVGVGAVMAATGVTLAVVFERRERSRRRRVERTYRRIAASLERRTHRMMLLLREVRAAISEPDPATAWRSGRARERLLDESRRQQARKVIRASERDPGRSHAEAELLRDDLRAAGVRRVGGGTLELSEQLGLLRDLDDALDAVRPAVEASHEALQHLRRARALSGENVHVREALKRVGETPAGHPLNPDRLFEDEGDLAAARSTLAHVRDRRLGADRAVRSSLAWHAHVASAGHLDAPTPPPGSRNVREPAGFLWAGTSVLVVVPLVAAVLAGTPAVDATWLDTILGASAVIGAALTTLYAVIREGSVDAIEAHLEDAVETAGRLAVILSDRLRTDDRRLVTQHSLEAGLGLQILPDTVAAVADAMVDPDETATKLTAIASWAAATGAAERLPVRIADRLTARTTEDPERNQRAGRLERFPVGADIGQLEGIFATTHASAHRGAGGLGPIPPWRENPPIDVLLLREGHDSDESAPILSVAFRPGDTSGWNAETGTERLPALHHPVRDGAPGFVPGTLEVHPEGEIARTSGQLLDELRAELDALLIAYPEALVSTPEEGGSSAELGARLRHELLGILLELQNRNLTPLWRFAGADSRIVTAADVIAVALEEAGWPARLATPVSHRGP